MPEPSCACWVEHSIPAHSPPCALPLSPAKVSWRRHDGRPREEAPGNEMEDSETFYKKKKVSPLKFCYTEFLNYTLGFGEITPRRCICRKVVHVSLREEDLQEDSTEQATAKLREADADVSLDTSSGDKKAEYKFDLFIVLPGNWHCASSIHTTSHVDSCWQGLSLDPPVMQVSVTVSVLRCPVGILLLLLLNVYIDFFEEWL